MIYRSIWRLNLPHSMANENPVHYWRAVEFGGMEVLRGTYRRHSFARHAHDEFALALVESGAVTFDLEGCTHHATPGCITLINPGEYHTGQAASNAGWSFRAIYPDVELVEWILHDVTPRPSGPLSFSRTVVENDLQAAVCFMDFHRSLERSESPLQLETQLLELLTVLVSRYGRHSYSRPRVGSERRAVNQARELLEENSSKNLSLNKLAESVGLSPFHLLRSFGQAFGVPPHVYQAQCRLRRAKTLLDSRLSPAQVAFETGYFDQSHFTREFRRRLGITPGQYIKGAGQLGPRDSLCPP